MNIGHRQEVNLLQNKQKKETPRLSFSVVSALSIVFLTVLSLMMWNDSTKLAAINKDIASIEKNNMFQKNNIIPTGDIGKYQLQLKALEKQLLNKYQLWANYQQITSTGKNGFSKNFYHIANLSHSDLSLYEINIYNKGKNLSLKGYSRKAKYIPVYIDGLKKQKEFDGVVFGDLSIERLADHPVVRFALERLEKESVEEGINHNLNLSDLMVMPLASNLKIPKALPSNDKASHSVGSVQ